MSNRTRIIAASLALTVAGTPEVASRSGVTAPVEKLATSGSADLETSGAANLSTNQAAVQRLGGGATRYAFQTPNYEPKPPATETTTINPTTSQVEVIPVVPAKIPAPAAPPSTSVTSQPKAPATPNVPAKNTNETHPPAILGENRDFTSAEIDQRVGTILEDLRNGKPVNELVEHGANAKFRNLEDNRIYECPNLGWTQKRNDLASKESRADMTPFGFIEKEGAVTVLAFDRTRFEDISGPVAPDWYVSTQPLIMRDNGVAVVSSSQQQPDSLMCTPQAA